MNWNQTNRWNAFCSLGVSQLLRTAKAIMMDDGAGNVFFLYKGECGVRGLPGEQGQGPALLASSIDISESHRPRHASPSFAEAGQTRCPQSLQHQRRQQMQQQQQVQPGP